MYIMMPVCTQEQPHAWLAKVIPAVKRLNSAMYLVPSVQNCKTRLNWYHGYRVIECQTAISYQNIWYEWCTPSWNVECADMVTIYTWCFEISVALTDHADVTCITCVSTIFCAYIFNTHRQKDEIYDTGTCTYWQTLEFIRFATIFSVKGTLNWLVYY